MQNSQTFHFTWNSQCFRLQIITRVHNLTHKIKINTKQEISVYHLEWSAHIVIASLNKSTRQCNTYVYRMVSVVHSNMHRKIMLQSINNAVGKAKSFQKLENENTFPYISSIVYTRIVVKYGGKYLATKKIVTIILGIYFPCAMQKPRNETLKCSLAYVKRISFCDMYFCVHFYTNLRAALFKTSVCLVCLFCRFAYALGFVVCGKINSTNKINIFSLKK